MQNTKKILECKMIKPPNFQKNAIPTRRGWVNPDTGERDKVKIKVKDNGEKVRVLRSSGNEIQATVSKK